MAFILFLMGLVGFAIWLLRKPTNTQFSSMGVLVGAMFLYGSFVPNLLNIPRPFGLTIIFFLAILTSVGLEKLKQTR